MSKTSLTHKRIEAGIDTDRRETREKNQENEKSVIDAETERRTLESLEGGTGEGFDEVVDNIREARDITSSEFEDGTEQLNEKHVEIKEHKEEIEQGLERTEKDGDNIDSAASEINSESAKSSLESARESVRQDMEILNEGMQQEEDIEQQSNEMNQQQLQRLKNAVGGS